MVAKLITCEVEGCTKSILADTLPLRKKRRCYDCELDLCWSIACGANAAPMTPAQRIEVRDALNRCRFFFDLIEDKIETEEQVGLLSAVMGTGPVARRVAADVREAAFAGMRAQAMEVRPRPMPAPRPPETVEERLDRMQREGVIVLGCSGCEPFFEGGGVAFGPRHKPSDRCESGKHPHCTCDVCF
jgi:hypothetical protein